MSYIGLLNESHLTTYTNVSASDDLTVGTSLRNLGTLTQVGAATFSGSLIGLLTTVSNGSDLTYTYTPATKTFNIQINNGSITNSKLSNSSISIDGQLMTLGASYTTQLSTITNAMLAGSIALSKLASGSPLQIIICNGSGIPTYSALTLNNLPFGTANQFLQTSGSSNAWITLSGDASLSSGVLTIGNAAITNAKLLNSSITLNGTSMSLGGTYSTTTPLLSITNGMLAGSIDNSKLLNNSITIGATNITLGGTVSTISPAILSTDSIKGSTTTSIIDLFTNTNQSNINSRTQIKYGLSNLTTPSASNPSLVLGSLEAGNLYDGVIHIYGSAGAKHCIQALSNNNLYLDNPSGGNLYINNRYGILNTLYNMGLTSLLSTNMKGTLTLQNSTPTTTITLNGSNGNVNANGITCGDINCGNITASGTISCSGFFNNWSKVSYNAFQHTTGIPITIWAILYSGTNILQTSITARKTGSAIKVTVNIPLSNWGATAQNKHLSIARLAGSPWVVGQNASGDIIGGTSVYGLHHILSGTTYDSVSFTYIDTFLITAGVTYYYGVCARANSTAMASAGIGNNAYVDIYCEELL